jgi:hypothetical protein
MNPLLQPTELRPVITSDFNRRGAGPATVRDEEATCPDEGADAVCELRPLTPLVRHHVCML